MALSPPSEIVIFDRREPCPYLEGETARLPFRWPLEPLSREQLDECLEQGDRRYGRYMYRTQCPDCVACQPFRLETHHFRPSATQRRVARKGHATFQVHVGHPVVDRQRVQLFNMHRRQRALARRDHDINSQEYRSFLVDTCCETLEISYSVQEKLVAVAIVDRGAWAMSAVYTFFDPEYSRFSPGVFSILTQIELCRKWDLKYLYLGFYIAASPHMAYKASYRPHQRRLEGNWQSFER